MASLLGDTQDPFAVLVNIEAEQALLGAILLDNRAFENIVDVVQARDFANPAHQRIFDAISKQMAAGLPVDAVSLKTMFDQDQGESGMPGITGQYLAKLMVSVVTIVNAPGYARIIADLARRRDLVVTAQDLMADAADLSDVERTAADVVADVERRILDIDQAASQGDAQSVGAIAGMVVQAAGDAFRAGGLVTVDTGLVDLDRILSGLDVGSLNILGGRPSMGKSALANTIALNVARRVENQPINPVMFFSLEMTAEQLGQRWIASLTGIETEDQRRGRIEEGQWQALVDAQNYLANLPIYVDDQARLSVAQMRQRARRVKRRLRGKLALVIVDHLQLVRQIGKRDNRNVELGEITADMKAMAKDLNCPVLCLSQLSRSLEQREDKRPILSDLRESGSIEQDADVVMFLYREEYYLERGRPKRKPNQTQASWSEAESEYETLLEDSRGMAEVLIPKNRTGRVGLVRLIWNASRQRFLDMARVQ